MDLLDRLLGQDVWTTRKLLEQAKLVSESDLNRKFDVDDRSLRECFIHILSNMETWVDLMSGRKPTNTDLSRMDQADLLTFLGRIGREFADLARKVSRENLWDATFVDTLANPPTKKTLGGGIAHLVTHSMHHRAQIMYMLEKLGQPHVEGDALSWETQAFGWK